MIDTVRSSFRDPAGRLVQVDGRVIRIIRRDGVAGFQRALSAPSLQPFIDSQQIASSVILPPSRLPNAFRERLGISHDDLAVEHGAVEFQSYPSEWPPEMLYGAGVLTLDIADAILADGLGLKDATPYNVLFSGAQPVFVDHLSLEVRDPQDPTWLAYAQFVRCFLLPLLVNDVAGIPLSSIFGGRRDGLEPQDAYRLCGTVARYLPPALTLVTLPTWLNAGGERRGGGLYKPRRARSAAQASFILRGLLRQVRRSLSRLAPSRRRQSAWSRYLEDHDNPGYLAAKSSLVKQILAERCPARVLDVGCNTGHFSMIAAEAGARVVAIDSDPIAVGRAWHNAREAHADIQTLVVDLRWPTPAVGWDNDECRSFLDRASGRFDLVLMLAILHHLLTDGVPLERILRTACRLTREWLLIEFVPRTDARFRQVARGRDDLYAMVTPDYFETVSAVHFDLVSRSPIDDQGRVLYLLRKKLG